MALTLLGFYLGGVTFSLGLALARWCFCSSCVKNALLSILWPFELAIIVHEARSQRRRAAENQRQLQALFERAVAKEPPLDPLGLWKRRQTSEEKAN